MDWVHLKLNDQAPRTVLCKDPFRSTDERVEKLIESLCLGYMCIYDAAEESKKRLRRYRGGCGEQAQAFD